MYPNENNGAIIVTELLFYWPSSFHVGMMMWVYQIEGCACYPWLSKIGFLQFFGLISFGVVKRPDPD